MRGLLPTLVLLLAAAPAPDRYTLATTLSVGGRVVASPTMTVNGGATSTIAAEGYRLTTRFRPDGDRVEVVADVALVSRGTVRKVGNPVLTGRLGDTMHWATGEVAIGMRVTRAE